MPLNSSGMDTGSKILKRVSALGKNLSQDLNPVNRDEFDFSHCCISQSRGGTLTDTAAVKLHIHNLHQDKYADYFPCRNMKVC